ncbi:MULTISPECIES: phycobilisome rod-core linker polypeptide [unclassified Microcoleus]|uniref:phycobilisome rod-core linker polypeptide n=1 Tax=unclassified Microcoleus TaxID=2642155 RepID=UPI002FCF16FD
MESQRLTRAESLLRNGEITVRELVRQVAKSDLYPSLFFNTNSAYRFIELNCKHLIVELLQNRRKFLLTSKFVTVKARMPKSILISIVTSIPRTWARILCLIL